MSQAELLKSNPTKKKAEEELLCERGHVMNFASWLGVGMHPGVYDEGWVCGMCEKDTTTQPEEWCRGRYCCEICESDCCIDCKVAWRMSRSCTISRTAVATSTITASSSSEIPPSSSTASNNPGNENKRRDVIGPTMMPDPSSSSKTSVGAIDKSSRKITWSQIQAQAGNVNNQDGAN